jgi:hypothetical protein
MADARTADKNCAASLPEGSRVGRRPVSVFGDPDGRYGRALSAGKLYSERTWAPLRVRTLGFLVRFSLHG